VGERGPEAPGFEIELSGHASGAPGATHALTGRMMARNRRTGRVDVADVEARARGKADFEVTVGARKFALGALGDDARSAIIMEALPTLVADARDLDVARLIRLAARDVPPDHDTPAGVSRRALLTRVIGALLAPAAGPLTDEAVHIATDLLEAIDLDPGAPERREIEELVWARLADPASPPGLTALAAKLGFATASPQGAEIP